MKIERSMMNILFYLGIVVPTIITIILFVLFLVCWHRLKIRKDILHKKHDPHGKMRQMGVSNAPPPPPVFVQLDLIHVNGGEDNDAYDVSQSPSNEQEQGSGGPFYHTPHDSGLSEMSELQCTKDRPHSQASQGSTDSEDSGFRSSRSGQYHPNSNQQLQDIPLLKPLKSNKDGAEKQTVRMSQCNKSGLNCGGPRRNWSPASLNSIEETHLQKVNLNHISTHISWMYLENLASPTPGDCAQTVTTAQIHHTSADSVPPDGDLFGYSVV